MYISYLPAFSIFSMQTYCLLVPFFPYSTFCFILYTEHVFLFLKYSTVLIATLSSESSAHFLVFKRSFLNLLKSFFVSFKFFQASEKPWFSGKQQRTNSFSYSQSKLQKETYNLTFFLIWAFHVICQIFYPVSIKP